MPVPVLPEDLRQLRDSSKKSLEENFCWKCGRPFRDKFWKEHLHDGKYWGERLPRIDIPISDETLRRIGEKLGI